MTDLAAAEAAWTKAKQTGVGEAEAKRRLAAARDTWRMHRDDTPRDGDAVATPASLAAKATNT